MSIELEYPRCDALLPDNLIHIPHLVADLKIDGSRYKLHIGENVDPYKRRLGNTLLSRNKSTIDKLHVDKTDNIPHITGKKYEGLGETILDGEVATKEFLKTNSIMNSSPEKAVAIQKKSGYLYFHVFDICYFKGIDVRRVPLKKRRVMLKKVIEHMNNPYVKVIQQVKGNLVHFFNQVVKKGGEGIVVKDERCAYGEGWSKLKKEYDVSCIVTGWKPGKNSNEGMIGSLAISVYHEGKLLEISYAAGFSEKLRKEMTENWEKYNGRVVDIIAQEIQPSKKARKAGNPIGRLRHARFHRFRDDILVESCTSEKLIEDLKNRPVKEEVKNESLR